MRWAFFFVLLHEISSWVIRLVMLYRIPRKHPPAASMAWLLVVFFWPWPGLFVYLAIGTNVLPKKRLQRHGALLEHLQKVHENIREFCVCSPEELPRDLRDMTDLASSLGHMFLVRGNRGLPFDRAEEFVASLVRDIDAAQREVHLLYYILVEDVLGKQLTQALARAAARGVRCRLLVDSVGSSKFLRRGARTLRKEGVEVVGALPVGIFRMLVSRFDLRNHRKIAVIDGVIGYSGSHNVVDSSYGHKNLRWEDISLRLEGPVVSQLQTIFLDDWYVDTEEFLEEAAVFPLQPQEGSIIMQTVPSGPSYTTENYQRLIVAALYGARERVVITTPYLVPDEAFLQGMEVAVLRGVQVQLIVPRRCDQFFVGNAGRAYFDELLRMGVEIYLFEENLLHAKTMTVDEDLSFFGSSNFDIRSFSLNFEVNHLLYGREVTQLLREKQEVYMSSSTRLTKEAWGERSFFSALIQGIAKLLSPLL